MTSTNLPGAKDSPSKESFNSSVDDEIDMFDLFDVLWNGKKVIVTITGLFAIGAIIYSLLQIEIYRAETLLAPVQSRESSSPLSSQLGGAAALVGINLGQTGDGKMNSILATLQSREFILKFIGENNLRASLYQDSTNSSEGPTDWQIYRTFIGIFNVTLESETGLVHLAIQWHDPVQAAEWLNLIVAKINAHEKARDVDEATNAIEYLQDQLTSTQLVEMQRVFYQLIESQTRVIMLTDVRDEYVFRVIDPAVVPDQRIAPRRGLIVIIGIFVGLMCASGFLLLRNAWKRDVALKSATAD